MSFCGWRAVGAAAGACLAVLLLGSSAWAATPAPAPTAGAFHASTWSCDTSTSVAAATASGTTGANVTACVVTAWASEVPAPEVTHPVVVVNSTPVPVAEANPVAAGTGGLSSSQFEVLSFTGGLLVFLLGAHVVAGWRS